MAEDSVVLVKNAKGRFVFASPEAAASLVDRSEKDKKGKSLAYVVDASSDEYKKGAELAQGGQGEGVRGGKVLERTGDGLVPKEG